MTSSVPHTETRFEFGANWRQFLARITDARIVEAEASLEQMLGRDGLSGKRFLDIGCGSGLFSLAARRLGAEVHSIDFDPLCVACALELKRIHFPNDSAWTIQAGSVLDSRLMSRLGTFDIVYSWGVLHHTGQMWAALSEACQRVSANGRMFIAIYNEQGVRSRWWWHVKRTYNRLPRILRPLYLGVFSVPMELGAAGVAVARGDPRRLVTRWTSYHSVRGMSRWHDLVDWIGGFPFEVAKPEEVLDFCRARGFSLERLVTCGGRMGCNEFLFSRGR
jgi:SAM-dependent methyltransferase